MNRSPNPHATHDELLLARLYGDDVTPVERATATAQIAGCGECAAFFAELGAITAATRALPVPARPQDFSLTAADAARLKPRSSGGMLGWIGRTRALGTSLTAVGLAGFVIVGALSALGPQLSFSATAASPGNFTNLAAATAAPAVPQLSGSGPLAAGGPAESSEAVAASMAAIPAATPAPSQAPAPTAASDSTFQETRIPTDHSSPAVAGLATIGSVPEASPVESSSGSVAYDSGAKSADSQAPAPERWTNSGGSNGPSGPDAGVVALAAFGAMLLAGLLLLAAPRLSLRRRRASR